MIRPAPGRVAVFCLGALLIVFGPYVALRVGIPTLFDTRAQAFADPHSVSRTTGNVRNGLGRFLLPGKVVVAAGAITWQFVTAKP